MFLGAWRCFDFTSGHYVHFDDNMSLGFSTKRFSSAPAQVHFYKNCDISGTIGSAFEKMKRIGQEVYEVPYHFSLYAYSEKLILNLKPARMIIDVRNKERQQ